MFFHCTFTNDSDLEKFLLYVDNGQITKIFTTFGESIGIALDMGLDKKADVILCVSSVERYYLLY